MHPPATVDPLAVAQASADNRLLAQYLLQCPGCGRPAVAHIDESFVRPALVRLVCPMACVVDATAVLALFPQADSRLSA